jgi:hypothetical protein
MAKQVCLSLLPCVMTAAINCWPAWATPITTSFRSTADTNPTQVKKLQSELLGKE